MYGRVISKERIDLKGKNKREQTQYNVSQSNVDVGDDKYRLIDTKDHPVKDSSGLVIMQED
jgi:hypothetical protein